MRKIFKAAAWAALFLACAGVGAYIAAHSDPFPPGVDRPGASPLASASPSGSPVKPQRWDGLIRTVANHEFYVGGSCQTRWRTSVRFRIDDRDAIHGIAVSHVIGDARCDFPQVQVQSQTIRSSLEGRIASSGVLSLVFEDPTPLPEGSGDLGGFLTFLEIPRLACQTVDGESAHLRYSKQRDDGERGIYRFSGSVELRCLSGCEAPTGP